MTGRGLPSDGNPKGFTLRQAGPGDITQMAKLYADCFDRPWSPDTFLSFLSNSNCETFVAVSEDRLQTDEIAGLEIHQTVLGEMELLTVCVAEPARRQGLGKYFISHLFERARALNAGTLFLEVAETNISALNLYQNLGFEKIALRKNYYKNSHDKSTDAVIMKKNLLLG